MSAYLSLIGRRRGGRLFEAGRLLTFSAFRMGAYSRWALIRGWALIRINTVIAIWIPDSNCWQDIWIAWAGWIADSKLEDSKAKKKKTQQTPDRRLSVQGCIQSLAASLPALRDLARGTSQLTVFPTKPGLSLISYPDLTLFSGRSGYEIRLCHGLTRGRVHGPTRGPPFFGFLLI